MAEPAIEKVFWAWRERVLDLKTRHPPPVHRHLQESRRVGRRVARARALAADRAADRAARDGGGAGRRASGIFSRRALRVLRSSMRQELKDGARVIAESADFVALAPYAPRFPFETWLMPKRHRSRFEEATPGEFASLARMLKDMLQRMNATLLTPPYNLIVHSAPLQEEAGERLLSLARRGDAEADARGRLRVGDRLLHQSDGAGRGGGGACGRRRSRCMMRL